MFLFYSLILFFFKQKTAYEVRISDWSSDVCSSDLIEFVPVVARAAVTPVERARVVDVQAVVRPAADHAGVRFAHRVVGDHRLAEIGRASCRERVWQGVDLGGRRIIKKKT